MESEVCRKEVPHRRQRKYEGDACSTFIHDLIFLNFAPRLVQQASQIPLTRSGIENKFENRDKIYEVGLRNSKQSYSKKGLSSSRITPSYEHDKQPTDIKIEFYWGPHQVLILRPKTGSSVSTQIHSDLSRQEGNRREQKTSELASPLMLNELTKPNPMKQSSRLQIKDPTLR